MSVCLRENLTFDAAKIQIVSESTEDGKGKNLFMSGIFAQADLQNQNGRVYPLMEIKRAVDGINEQIQKGYSVLGEADHPDDLKINIDRVSHMITKMWMDGSNGFGKLKIIPTPMGQIVSTMLESGVKLGVSTRGTGNVNESNGRVSDFDMITVDIVAQPSAPNAYPTPMYESLMNMRHGHKVFAMAKESVNDKKVQKFLAEEVKRFISELKV
jgi:hypothetical protein